MPEDLSEELLSWATEKAYPWWAELGPDWECGGFFERLHHTGAPLLEMRRARLTARQIYCFAEGRHLGWQGPSEEIVRHGFEFINRHLIREDGTVVMSISRDGLEIKDLYDPYDYAFVIFSLAYATRELGDFDRIANLAKLVRDKLITTWSHPESGFEEALPRTLPLKSNPQMRLLEAFLAWEEIDPDPWSGWAQAADRIATLALEKLILPESGALCEFYDGDWKPLPDTRGLQIEPGHLFEWSWLLSRWSLLRDDRAAFGIAVKLAALGETYGIDSARGVAINAVDENFVVRDSDAKLWPQTERAKAWHLLSHHPMNAEADQARALENTQAALEGLRKFIVVKDGYAPFWHEVMKKDGSFVDEPVRASSFYHIICAISTVNELKPERKKIK